MLILTRHDQERIYITTADDEVVVITVMLHRRRVRIGIDAPMTYRIEREEIVPEALRIPREKPR